VNAPLVLETIGGIYTFASNSTTSTATLSFGGGITSGASSGTNTLFLTGSNTGTNTISGVIANGGSGGAVGLTVQSGSWDLSAPNTYTGTTTITGGTLQVAAARWVPRRS